MAWRRDSLRVRLTSARSIEETGLDTSLLGDFLSPHVTSSPAHEIWSKTVQARARPGSSLAMGNLNNCCNSECTSVKNPKVSSGKHSANVGETEQNFGSASERIEERRKHKKGHGKDEKSEVEMTREKSTNDEDLVSTKDVAEEVKMEDLAKHKGSSRKRRSRKSFQSSEDGKVSTDSTGTLRALSRIAEENHELSPNSHLPSNEEPQVLRWPDRSFGGFEVGDRDACFDSKGAQIQCSDEQEEILLRKVNSSGSSVQSMDLLSPDISSIGSHFVQAEGAASTNARNRWRRLRHAVTAINGMSANIRAKEDAGGVGAAAFEGAQITSKRRHVGRKGMEGLTVRQEQCFITWVQDFYVTFLKMSMSYFFIGVFLAPVALGLLFTPLYLLDVNGLTLNEPASDGGSIKSLASVKESFLTVMNIFLYALSLSTTFGGSPVSARSPYCLLVANANTLVAQFLFVFLSGAVFARMSQPSQPIRCSKKAVIKTDDTVMPDSKKADSYKVFAVRLVLTGPPPCELVDAKICLTFRIFIKLPSGSLFCSTQDLELVRSEVSYLRYGLIVRHIIDEKSPVYGHTMESLYEGDASFSLTVMGMERASMQNIFHIEDYFVCDRDVIWDHDYADFIHINNKGQRVLDHSKIDALKPVKAIARASQAITRMKNLARHKDVVEETQVIDSGVIPDGESELVDFKSVEKNYGLKNPKLWKCKSSSFTRANG